MQIARLLTLLALVALGTTAAANQTPRIIGGKDVPKGDHTYMVALVDASSKSNFAGQFCGGTLIDRFWVLTAAHCTYGLKPEDMAVVVGEHVLMSNQQGRLEVDGIINHPSYIPSFPNVIPLVGEESFTFDVALVHIKRSAEARDIVNSVDLVPVWSHLMLGPLFVDGLKPMVNGQDVMAVGWGVVNDEFGTSNPSLQYVDLDFMTTETCAEAVGYEGFEPFPSDVICAALLQVVPDGDATIIGGKDSCFGDSGGPLLDSATGTQVGIVSFGPGDCASTLAPGAYTATGSYLAFLANSMSQADLAVKVTGFDDTEGDFIGRFRVEVTNQSPENEARDVRISFSQSRNFRVTDIRGPNCSARTMSCSIGKLGPNQTIRMLVEATGESYASVRLGASASTSTGDSDSSDDFAVAELGLKPYTLFADDGGGSLPPALLLLAGLLALRRRR